MKAIPLYLILLLLISCPQVDAVYMVRISDLGHSPLPANPIRVFGTVTSESPLKITDGRSTIEVSGVSAGLGDFLIVEGDWNDAVLTVPQLPEKAFLYPARLKSEMVYVPAGSFLMGNTGVGDDLTYGWPDELPQHSVYVSGYWIGKYEVTRGQYRQFMDAGGYSNPDYWSADGWAWKLVNHRTEPYYWAPLQNWGSGNFTQTDDYPVVGVTYYEAEAFCGWAGGHLPTEAQWEKAARWDGHPRIYPWGDVWDADNANSCLDTIYPGNQTAPVGSYPTGISPNGCLDMTGNAWEWCHDWFQQDYYSQTPAGGWIDPQGPPFGDFGFRSLRGGSWNNDFDWNTRCSAHDLFMPDSNWYDGGLRLAK